MTILHISISALHATFRRWECPSCLKENSIMRQLAFGIKRCVRNLTFMPANTLTPSFQCLNNPGICPGFKSVVRERGPSSVGIKCLGRLCTTRIKPFPGSLTCTLGFCLKCCCLAHNETVSIPACRESKHSSKATSKPSMSIPLTSTSTISSPNSTPIPTPTSTPSSSQPLRPASFAVPLSQTYQDRLLELHSQRLTDVSTLAATRTHVKQQARVLKVYWWTKVRSIPCQLFLSLSKLIYLRTMNFPIFSKS